MRLLHDRQARARLRRRRFQIFRAGDYSILIRRLPPPFGPSTGAFYPGFTRMDSRP
nr:MAG TPA: hypothetical protein [Caudoviricetes sp.]